jgi:hypothetical protein
MYLSKAKVFERRKAERPNIQQNGEIVPQNSLSFPSSLKLIVPPSCERGK